MRSAKTLDSRSPAQLSSALSVPEHDLEELEELYTEREQLLQELEKDS